MIQQNFCRRSAHKKVKVSRPELVLFALAALLVWDGTGLARMALAASLLHEAGHIVVFAVLLHRLPELTVSVTGICLSMRGVILSPGRRLLLAVAGPCANFLCCVLFLICMESWAGYSYAGHWFAAANVLTGGFNLLPLPGLDGAAAVDCLRQLQIGTKCFASEKLHSGQK